VSVQTLYIDLFYVCQRKKYCVEIEQESRDREIVLVFLTHLESRRQPLMTSNRSFGTIHFTDPDYDIVDMEQSFDPGLHS